MMRRFLTLGALPLAVFVTSAGFAAEVPSVPAEDASAAAFLQGEVTPATCTGKIGVLRFSRAARDGTYEGFKDAVRQHRDWLVGRGFADVDFAVHKARFGRGGEVGFGSLITYPTAARFAEVNADRAGSRDEVYETFVTSYKTHTESYSTVTLCLEDPAAAAPAPDAATLDSPEKADTRP